MPSLPELADEVLGSAPRPDQVSVLAAPGRVNLIGDHTDYCLGLVLPMAIDRWCVVGAGPPGSLRSAIAGEVVVARSAELAGEVVVRCDGTTDPPSVDPPWGRFVAGVVRAVTDRGGAVAPVELSFRSTVPVGAGLSSSSALAVACTLALAAPSGLRLDGRAVAQLALDAEVLATGVPGGLMDQLCSIFGEPAHALLIDCRSLQIRPVPLPHDVAVVVVHSGVGRTLAASAYADRRAACEAAARRLGLAQLRDATIEQVADDPRARHVVAENARVIASADALARGDLDALGPLLIASHASLRDDFEVSTPELDALVEILVECGAAGARLTGAGFGGCVVALVPSERAGDVARDAAQRYRIRTGLTARAFVARAVGGAGPISR